MMFGWLLGWCSVFLGSAGDLVGRINRGGTEVGDRYKGKLCSVFVRVFVLTEVEGLTRYWGEMF